MFSSSYYNEEKTAINGFVLDRLINKKTKFYDEKIKKQKLKPIQTKLFGGSPTGACGYTYPQSIYPLALALSISTVLMLMIKLMQIQVIDCVNIGVM